MTKINIPKDSYDLHMIPVGGCGEFGMNMMLYIYKNEALVVDCGVVFSEPFRLGTDALMPDFAELDVYLESCEKVHYLMTHGHEDHIGAAPYLLKHKKQAMYCTRWTHELIQNKLDRLGWKKELGDSVKIVEAGKTQSLGSFNISWIHVNHSIPMACSLWIDSPGAKVYHTADFKVDMNSSWEPPYDFPFLKQLAKNGCDALISDSTNASRDGQCGAEDDVYEPLLNLVKTTDGLCVISTFSSNLYRLLTVLKIARDAGKSAGILGGGMMKCIEVARSLDMIPDELDKVIVEPRQLKHIDRDDLLVLASGCQGEITSGLNRLIRGEHNQLKLKEGDTIILSSRIIPGSEKSIFRIFDQCKKLGYNVWTTKDHPEIHVSGHAHADDVRMVIDAINPSFHIPVHGGHVQLLGNAERASDLEYLNVSNGDVITVSPTKVETIGSVDFNRTFLDAMNRLPISYERVRERLRVGENGAVIVSATFKPDRTLNNCRINIWGVAFESEARENSFKRGIENSLTEAAQINESGDVGVLEENIRIKIRKQLFQLTRKKVVVQIYCHL